jgi:hypothetical protein
VHHIAQTSAALATELLQIGEATRLTGHRVADRIAAVARQVLDPYRPELHYMRGPGPKWREKHRFGAAPRPPLKVFAQRLEPHRPAGK